MYTVHVHVDTFLIGEIYTVLHVVQYTCVVIETLLLYVYLYMYCTTPSSFLHHSLPPSLPLFIPPSLTLPSLPPFLPFFNRSSFRT